MLKYILIFVIVISLTPFAFAGDHGIPKHVETQEPEIEYQPPEPVKEPDSESLLEIQIDLEKQNLRDRIQDLRFENIELRKEIRELNHTIEYLNDQISLIAKEMAYSFMQLNEWYKTQLIN